jgi:hypothetical protein
MRRACFAILAAAILCGGAAPAQDRTATITISQAGGVPISPLLYGVNYQWDKVPASEFASYRAAMSGIAHASLSRYLGGWGAEHYDWSSNLESGKWGAGQPGEAPEGFLEAVPAASFITPSARAISHPEMIPETTAETAALVARYGGRVAYWEIGNEWWLQSGARLNPQKRARNLAGYARLLASVVPAMKNADPNIKVFAMADWTAPDEVARLRALTGPAWAQIDGISVHTYCGTTDSARLCTNLPAGITAIRQASGKTLIYASEWAAVRGMNPDDDGMRNAELTVRALGDMADAGIDLAAYWPPVKAVPALAFVGPDYRMPSATGVAFGWMAQYYEGTALPTGGDVPALAARDGGRLTVIVLGGNRGPMRVRILLDGTGMTRVDSAAVLYAVGGEMGAAGRAAGEQDLPVSIVTADGRGYMEFEINSGGSDDIARVTLR